MSSGNHPTERNIPRKLNETQLIETKKRRIKKPSITLRTGLNHETRNGVLKVSLSQDKQQTSEARVVDIAIEDTNAVKVHQGTTQNKIIENRSENASLLCSSDNTTNATMCNVTTQGNLVKKPNTSERIPNVKSKITVGSVRRVSSRLCDRTITRRKSFLKKGDGACLLAKKRTLNKQDTKTCKEDGSKTLKKDDSPKSTTKIKTSLLCLAKKNEVTNSTFITRRKYTSLTLWQ